ncbi:MAG: hypothetical protein KA166_07775, partial [Saprospiraceae bacterium]|nr:hypothetical protein [Saprospiraceae bacterium]
LHISVLQVVGCGVPGVYLCVKIDEDHFPHQYYICAILNRSHSLCNTGKGFGVNNGWFCPSFLSDWVKPIHRFV